MSWCACWLCAAAAAPLEWLRAEGLHIVDAHGKPVVLRGVNLGGWLVEEMWMMPFVTKPPTNSAFIEIRDHVSLARVLEQRFGAAEVQRLRVAWRKAWLDEADFVRIRTNGLNCVRLPFLYDLAEEPGGLYPWLDEALGWAQRQGLYVILDLHGAPGRQSKDHHTGEAGRNQLFSNPDMVRRTAELWGQIAQRYRHRPEVAGYDLLNEPMGAPDNLTLYDVQAQLYRAIRAVDPRHLIFIEDGYKGAEHMPTPQGLGWTNVVYSIHSYRFDAKSPQDQVRHLDSLLAKLEEQQRRIQAPFYVGEFNLEPWGTPALLATFLQHLGRHGFSWSLWTYKTAMPNGSGTRSLWGWFRSPGKRPPLDPFRDSAAALRLKSAQLRTESLTEYEGMSQAFRNSAP
jgi:hypothetical protein